jgi:Na+/phosphate symporter
MGSRVSRDPNTSSSDSTAATTTSTSTARTSARAAGITIAIVIGPSTLIVLWFIFAIVCFAKYNSCHNNNLYDNHHVDLFIVVSIVGRLVVFACTWHITYDHHSYHHLEPKRADERGAELARIIIASRELTWPKP